MCVHPQPAADATETSDQDRPPDWSAQARRTIDVEFSAAHPESGWELIQVIGDAGPELVRMAEDADLLVVGRHQASPDHRRTSVAAYCAETSTVPVVIVPSPVGARSPQSETTSSIIIQAE